MIIHFTVPGDPVGKGRPRFARRGKFVATYTPEKTANYENLVKLAASTAMNGTSPFAGACLLNIKAYCSIPQSWSKKKQADALAGVVRPTTKPDGDNIIKAVGDAINGICFADDKQAVDIVISKRYAEIPRLDVVVSEI